jgi:hypothetical protein
VPQTGFLAYILKFDPEAARPLIQRAVAARDAGSNACRHSVFMDIGIKHQSPVLEDLAVTSLNDPDPQVAANAAAYLGRYGSEAAEQPLWTRYLAWSRDWTGREKELRTGFGASENPNLWQSSLGQNLARALAEGNGWFYDDAQLRRLRDVAVGEGDRSMVESALQSASGRAIGFIPNFSEPPGSYRVAQYDQLTNEQLRAKLAQFPAGTVFHWASYGLAESPDQVKAFRGAADAAEKSGMKLVRD